MWRSTSRATRSRRGSARTASRRRPSTARARQASRYHPVTARAVQPGHARQRGKARFRPRRSRRCHRARRLRIELTYEDPRRARAPAAAPASTRTRPGSTVSRSDSAGACVPTASRTSRILRPTAAMGSSRLRNSRTARRCPSTACRSALQRSALRSRSASGTCQRGRRRPTPNLRCTARRRSSTDAACATTGSTSPTRRSRPVQAVSECRSTFRLA